MVIGDVVSVLCVHVVVVVVVVVVDRRGPW